MASAGFGGPQGLIRQCFQRVARTSLGTRQLPCLLYQLAIRDGRNQQIARYRFDELSLHVNRVVRCAGAVVATIMFRMRLSV